MAFFNPYEGFDPGNLSPSDRITIQQRQQAYYASLGLDPNGNPIPKPAPVPPPTPAPVAPAPVVNPNLPSGYNNNPSGTTYYVNQVQVPKADYQTYIQKGIVPTVVVPTIRPNNAVINLTPAEVTQMKTVFGWNENTPGYNTFVPTQSSVDYYNSLLPNYNEQIARLNPPRTDSTNYALGSYAAKPPVGSPEYYATNAWANTPTWAELHPNENYQMQTQLINNPTGYSVLPTASFEAPKVLPSTIHSYLGQNGVVSTTEYDASLPGNWKYNPSGYNKFISDSNAAQMQNIMDNNWAVQHSTGGHGLTQQQTMQNWINRYGATNPGYTAALQANGLQPITHIGTQGYIQNPVQYTYQSYTNKFGATSYDFLPVNSQPTFTNIYTGKQFVENIQPVPFNMTSGVPGSVVKQQPSIITASGVFYLATPKLDAPANPNFFQNQITPQMATAPNNIFGFFEPVGKAFEPVTSAVGNAFVGAMNAAGISTKPVDYFGASPGIKTPEPQYLKTGLFAPQPISSNVSNQIAVMGGTGVGIFSQSPQFSVSTPSAPIITKDNPFFGTGLADDYVNPITKPIIDFFYDVGELEYEGAYWGGRAFNGNFKIPVLSDIANVVGGTFTSINSLGGLKGSQQRASYDVVQMYDIKEQAVNSGVMDVNYNFIGDNTQARVEKYQGFATQLQGLEKSYETNIANAKKYKDIIAGSESENSKNMWGYTALAGGTVKNEQGIGIYNEGVAGWWEKRALPVIGKMGDTAFGFENLISMGGAKYAKDSVDSFFSTTGIKPYTDTIGESIMMAPATAATFGGMVVAGGTQMVTHPMVIPASIAQGAWDSRYYLPAAVVAGVTMGVGAVGLVGFMGETGGFALTAGAETMFLRSPEEGGGNPVAAVRASADMMVLGMFIGKVGKTIFNPRSILEIPSPVKAVTGFRTIDVEVGTPYIKQTGGKIGEVLGIDSGKVTGGEARIKGITWTNPIKSTLIELGLVPEWTQGTKLHVNEAGEVSVTHKSNSIFNTKILRASVEEVRSTWWNPKYAVPTGLKEELTVGKSVKLTSFSEVMRPETYKTEFPAYKETSGGNPALMTGIPALDKPQHLGMGKDVSPKNIVQHANDWINYTIAKGEIKGQKRTAYVELSKIATGEVAIKLPGFQRMGKTPTKISWDLSEGILPKVRGGEAAIRFDFYSGRFKTEAQATAFKNSLDTVLKYESIYKGTNTYAEWKGLWDTVEQAKKVNPQVKVSVNDVLSKLDWVQNTKGKAPTIIDALRGTEENPTVIMGGTTTHLFGNEIVKPLSDVDVTTAKPGTKANTIVEETGWKDQFGLGGMGTPEEAALSPSAKITILDAAGKEIDVIDLHTPKIRNIEFGVEAPPTIKLEPGLETISYAEQSINTLFRANMLGITNEGLVGLTSKSSAIKSNVDALIAINDLELRTGLPGSDVLKTSLKNRIRELPEDILVKDISMRAADYGLSMNELIGESLHEIKTRKAAELKSQSTNAGLYADTGFKFMDEKSPTTTIFPESKRIMSKTGTFGEYIDVTELVGGKLPSGKALKLGNDIMVLEKFEPSFRVSDIITKEIEVPDTFNVGVPNLKDFDPFGINFGETTVEKGKTVSVAERPTKLSSWGLNPDIFKNVILREGYIPNREAIITVPATVGLLDKYGMVLPKREKPLGTDIPVNEEQALSLIDSYKDIQTGKITTSEMFLRQLSVIETASKNIPKHTSTIYNPYDVIARQEWANEKIKTGYDTYINKILPDIEKQYTSGAGKHGAAHSEGVYQSLIRLKDAYPELKSYTNEELHAIAYLHDITNLTGDKVNPKIKHERVAAEAIAGGYLDHLQELAGLTPERKGVVAQAIQESHTINEAKISVLGKALQLADKEYWSNIEGKSGVIRTSEKPVMTEFGVEFLAKPDYFKGLKETKPLVVKPSVEMTIGEYILTTIKEEFPQHRIGGSLGQAVQMKYTRGFADIDLYLPDAAYGKFRLKEILLPHEEILLKHNIELKSLFDIHELAAPGTDIGRFGFRTQRDVKIEGLSIMPLKEQVLRKATQIAEIRQATAGARDVLSGGTDLATILNPNAKGGISEAVYRFYTGTEPHRGKDLADTIGAFRNAQNDILNNKVFNWLLNTPANKTGEPHIDILSTIPRAIGDVKYTQKVWRLALAERAIEPMMSKEYMPSGGINARAGQENNPLLSAQTRLESYTYITDQSHYMRIPLTGRYVEPGTKLYNAGKWLDNQAGKFNDLVGISRMDLNRGHIIFNPAVMEADIRIISEVREPGKTAPKTTTGGWDMGWDVWGGGTAEGNMGGGVTHGDGWVMAGVGEPVGGGKTQPIINSRLLLGEGRNVIHLGGIAEEAVTIAESNRPQIKVGGMMIRENKLRDLGLTDEQISADLRSYTTLGLSKEQTNALLGEYKQGLTYVEKGRENEPMVQGGRILGREWNEAIDYNVELNKEAILTQDLTRLVNPNATGNTLTLFIDKAMSGEIQEIFPRATTEQIVNNVMKATEILEHREDIGILLNGVPIRKNSLYPSEVVQPLQAPGLPDPFTDVHMLLGKSKRADRTVVDMGGVVLKTTKENPILGKIDLDENLITASALLKSVGKPGIFYHASGSTKLANTLIESGIAIVGGKSGLYFGPSKTLLPEYLVGNSILNIFGSGSTGSIIKVKTTPQMPVLPTGVSILDSIGSRSIMQNPKLYKPGSLYPGADALYSKYQFGYNEFVIPRDTQLYYVGKSEVELIFSKNYSETIPVIEASLTGKTKPIGIPDPFKDTHMLTGKYERIDKSGLVWQPGKEELVPKEPELVDWARVNINDIVGKEAAFYHAGSESGIFKELVNSPTGRVKIGLQEFYFGPPDAVLTHYFPEEGKISDKAIIRLIGTPEMPNISGLKDYFINRSKEEGLDATRLSMEMSFRNLYTNNNIVKKNKLYVDLDTVEDSFYKVTTKKGNSINDVGLNEILDNSTHQFVIPPGSTLEIVGTSMINNIPVVDVALGEPKKPRVKSTTTPEFNPVVGIPDVFKDVHMLQTNDEIYNPLSGGSLLENYNKIRKSGADKYDTQSQLIKLYGDMGLAVTELVSGRKILNLSKPGIIFEDMWLAGEPDTVNKLYPNIPKELRNRNEFGKLTPLERFAVNKFVYKDGKPVYPARGNLRILGIDRGEFLNRSMLDVVKGIGFNLKLKLQGKTLADLPAIENEYLARNVIESQYEVKDIIWHESIDEVKSAHDLLGQVGKEGVFYHGTSPFGIVDTLITKGSLQIEQGNENAMFFGGDNQIYNEFTHGGAVRVKAAPEFPIEMQYFMNLVLEKNIKRGHGISTAVEQAILPHLEPGKIYPGPKPLMGMDYGILEKEFVVPAGTNLVYNQNPLEIYTRGTHWKGIGELFAYVDEPMDVYGGSGKSSRLRIADVTMKPGHIEGYNEGIGTYIKFNVPESFDSQEFVVRLEDIVSTKVGIIHEITSEKIMNNILDFKDHIIYGVLPQSTNSDLINSITNIPAKIDSKISADVTNLKLNIKYVYAPKLTNGFLDDISKVKWGILGSVDKINHSIYLSKAKKGKTTPIENAMLSEWYDWNADSYLGFSNFKKGFKLYEKEKQQATQQQPILNYDEMSDAEFKEALGYDPDDQDAWIKHMQDTEEPPIKDDWLDPPEGWEPQYEQQDVVLTEILGNIQKVKKGEITTGEATKSTHDLWISELDKLGLNPTETIKEISKQSTQFDEITGMINEIKTEGKPSSIPDPFKDTHMLSTLKSGKIDKSWDVLFAPSDDIPMYTDLAFPKMLKKYKVSKKTVGELEFNGWSFDELPVSEYYTPEGESSLSPIYASKPITIRGVEYTLSEIVNSNVLDSFSRNIKKAHSDYDLNENFDLIGRNVASNIWMQGNASETNPVFAITTKDNKLGSMLKIDLQASELLYRNAQRTELAKIDYFGSPLSRRGIGSVLFEIGEYSAAKSGSNLVYLENPLLEAVPFYQARNYEFKPPAKKFPADMIKELSGTEIKELTRKYGPNEPSSIPDPFKDVHMIHIEPIGGMGEVKYVSGGKPLAQELSGELLTPELRMYDINVRGEELKLFDIRTRDDLKLVKSNLRFADTDYVSGSDFFGLGLAQAALSEKKPNATSPVIILTSKDLVVSALSARLRTNDVYIDNIGSPLSRRGFGTASLDYLGTIAQTEFSVDKLSLHPTSDAKPFYSEQGFAPTRSTTWQKDITDTFSLADLETPSLMKLRQTAYEFEFIYGKTGAFEDAMSLTKPVNYRELPSNRLIQKSFLSPKGEMLNYYESFTNDEALPLENIFKKGLELPAKGEMALKWEAKSMIEGALARKYQPWDETLGVFAPNYLSLVSRGNTLIGASRIMVGPKKIVGDRVGSIIEGMGIGTIFSNKLESVANEWGIPRIEFEPLEGSEKFHTNRGFTFVKGSTKYEDRMYKDIELKSAPLDVSLESLLPAALEKKPVGIPDPFKDAHFLILDSTGKEGKVRHIEGGEPLTRVLAGREIQPLFKMYELPFGGDEGQYKLMDIRSEGSLNLVKKYIKFDYDNLPEVNKKGLLYAKSAINKFGVSETSPLVLLTDRGNVLSALKMWKDNDAFSISKLGSTIPGNAFGTIALGYAEAVALDEFSIEKMSVLKPAKGSEKFFEGEGFVAGTKTSMVKELTGENNLFKEIIDNPLPTMFEGMVDSTPRLHPGVFTYSTTPEGMEELQFTAAGYTHHLVQKDLISPIYDGISFTYLEAFTNANKSPMYESIFKSSLNTKVWDVYAAAERNDYEIARKYDTNVLGERVFESVTLPSYPDFDAYRMMEHALQRDQTGTGAVAQNPNYLSLVVHGKTIVGASRIVVESTGPQGLERYRVYGDRVGVIIPEIGIGRVLSTKLKDVAAEWNAPEIYFEPLPGSEEFHQKMGFAFDAQLSSQSGDSMMSMKLKLADIRNYRANEVSLEKLLETHAGLENLVNKATRGKDIVSEIKSKYSGKELTATDLEDINRSMLGLPKGIPDPFKDTHMLNAKPEVYLSIDQLEYQKGWGGEKPYHLTKESGEMIKGVIDLKEVPAELYHVTTNLPAVMETGFLRHIGEGAGLGKGTSLAHMGVSLTSSLLDAQLIFREMVRTVEVAKGKPLDIAIQEWQAQDEFLSGVNLQAAVDTAMSQYKFHQEHGRGSVENHAIDALNMYRYSRETATNNLLENPIIFGDASKFAGIDIDNIGVVMSTAREIPVNAVVRKPLGDFMHEIMVHGEVRVTTVLDEIKPPDISDFRQLSETPFNEEYYKYNAIQTFAKHAPDVVEFLNDTTLQRLVTQKVKFWEGWSDTPGLGGYAGIADWKNGIGYYPGKVGTALHELGHAYDYNFMVRGQVTQPIVARNFMTVFGKEFGDTYVSSSNKFHEGIGDILTKEPLRIPYLNTQNARELQADLFREFNTPIISLMIREALPTGTYGILTKMYGKSKFDVPTTPALSGLLKEVATTGYTSPVEFEGRTGIKPKVYLEITDLLSGKGRNETIADIISYPKRIQKLEGLVASTEYLDIATLPVEESIGKYLGDSRKYMQFKLEELREAENNKKLGIPDPFKDIHMLGGKEEQPVGPATPEQKWAYEKALAYSNLRIMTGGPEKFGDPVNQAYWKGVHEIWSTFGTTYEDYVQFPGGIWQYLGGEKPRPSSIPDPFKDTHMLNARKVDSIEELSIIDKTYWANSNALFNRANIPWEDWKTQPTYVPSDFVSEYVPKIFPDWENFNPVEYYKFHGYKYINENMRDLETMGYPGNDPGFGDIVGGNYGDITRIDLLDFSMYISDVVEKHRLTENTTVYKAIKPYIAEPLLTLGEYTEFGFQSTTRSPTYALQFGDLVAKTKDIVRFDIKRGTKVLPFDSEAELLLNMGTVMSLKSEPLMIDNLTINVNGKSNFFSKGENIRLFDVDITVPKPSTKTIGERIEEYGIPGGIPDPFKDTHMLNIKPLGEGKYNWEGTILSKEFSVTSKKVGRSIIDIYDIRSEHAKNQILYPIDDNAAIKTMLSDYKGKADEVGHWYATRITDYEKVSANTPLILGVNRKNQLGSAMLLSFGKENFGKIEAFGSPIRGKGIGSEVLRTAEDIAVNDFGKSMFRVFSSINAEKWYKNRGFEDMENLGSGELIKVLPEFKLKVIHETTKGFADILTTQGIVPSLKPDIGVVTEFAPGRGADRQGAYVALPNAFSKGGFGDVRLTLGLKQSQLKISPEMENLGYKMSDLEFTLGGENGAVTTGTIPKDAIETVEVYNRNNNLWDVYTPAEYRLMRGIEGTPQLPTAQEFRARLEELAKTGEVMPRKIEGDVGEYTHADLETKIDFAMDVGLIKYPVKGIPDPFKDVHMIRGEKEPTFVDWNKVKIGKAIGKETYFYHADSLGGIFEELKNNRSTTLEKELYFGPPNTVLTHYFARFSEKYNGFKRLEPEEQSLLRIRTSPKMPALENIKQAFHEGDVRIMGFRELYSNAEIFKPNKMYLDVDTISVLANHRLFKQLGSIKDITEKHVKAAETHQFIIPPGSTIKVLGETTISGISTLDIGFGKGKVKGIPDPFKDTHMMKLELKELTETELPKIDVRPVIDVSPKKMEAPGYTPPWSPPPPPPFNAFGELPARDGGNTTIIKEEIMDFLMNNTADIFTKHLNNAPNFEFGFMGRRNKTGEPFVLKNFRQKSSYESISFDTLDTNIPGYHEEMAETIFVHTHPSSYGYKYMDDALAGFNIGFNDSRKEITKLHHYVPTSVEDVMNHFTGGPTTGHEMRTLTFMKLASELNIMQDITKVSVNSGRSDGAFVRKFVEKGRYDILEAISAYDLPSEYILKIKTQDEILKEYGLEDYSPVELGKVYKPVYRKGYEKDVKTLPTGMIIPEQVLNKPEALNATEMLLDKWYSAPVASGVDIKTFVNRPFGANVVLADLPGARDKMLAGVYHQNVELFNEPGLIRNRKVYQEILPFEIRSLFEDKDFSYGVGKYSVSSRVIHSLGSMHVYNKKFYNTDWTGKTLVDINTGTINARIQAEPQLAHYSGYDYYLFELGNPEVNEGKLNWGYVKDVTPAQKGPFVYTDRSVVTSLIKGIPDPFKDAHIIRAIPDSAKGKLVSLIEQSKNKEVELPLHFDESWGVVDIKYEASPDFIRYEKTPDWSKVTWAFHTHPSEITFSTGDVIGAAAKKIPEIGVTTPNGMLFTLSKEGGLPVSFGMEYRHREYAAQDKIVDSWSDGWVKNALKTYISEGRKGSYKSSFDYGITHGIRNEFMAKLNPYREEILGELSKKYNVQYEKINLKKPKINYLIESGGSGGSGGGSGTTKMDFLEIGLPSYNKKTGGKSEYDYSYGTKGEQKSETYLGISPMNINAIVPSYHKPSKKESDNYLGIGSAAVSALATVYPSSGSVSELDYGTSYLVQPSSGNYVGINSKTPTYPPAYKTPSYGSGVGLYPGSSTGSYLGVGSYTGSGMTTYKAGVGSAYTGAGSGSYLGSGGKSYMGSYLGAGSYLGSGAGSYLGSGSGSYLGSGSGSYLGSGTGSYIGTYTTPGTGSYLGSGVGSYLGSGSGSYLGSGSGSYLGSGSGSYIGSGTYPNTYKTGNYPSGSGNYPGYPGSKSGSGVTSGRGVSVVSGVSTFIATAAGNFRKPKAEPHRLRRKKKKKEYFLFPEITPTWSPRQMATDFPTRILNRQFRIASNEMIGNVQSPGMTGDLRGMDNSFGISQKNIKPGSISGIKMKSTTPWNVIAHPQKVAKQRKRRYAQLGFIT